MQDHFADPIMRDLQGQHGGPLWTPNSLYVGQEGMSFAPSGLDRLGMRKRLAGLPEQTDPSDVPTADANAPPSQNDESIGHGHGQSLTNEGSSWDIVENSETVENGGDQYPYSCAREGCNWRFEREEHLAHRNQKFHIEGKRHVCLLCPDPRPHLKERKDLEKHYRTRKHTDLKHYRCTSCRKKFRRKDTQVESRHQRSCRGSRPWQGIEKIPYDELEVHAGPSRTPSQATRPGTGSSSLARSFVSSSV